MPKCVKRALLLLTAAALLLTSLCACTGDTEPGSSGPVTAQSGELPNGNSVTVGIAQDIASLDPHMATTAGTREVMFNLFEGLVKAGPGGSVIPAVASDYKLSEDAKTYTFTLREGVTFHNGEQVTVQDVLYSLERCAGSENDGVPLISAFSVVETVAADEDGHILIVLKEPQLEFINSVASAPIIPANSGPAITDDPIGTGPFKFVSYAPQDNLVMEKYDGYWGGKARLDRVTFKIIADVNAMVIGLRGGTLDMVIHLPNTLEGEVKDEFTVHQDTMKLVQALYINNAVKPFDNALVRQAMYYAINVDEIIEFVCGGAGVATGTSMYPAQKDYFMPELAGKYTQNVEKAKELLAQAGYPDGFSMKITVPSNYAQHVQTAEVIIEQLKAVNIKAELELVEWGAWYDGVYKGREYETTVSGVSASDMTAREMLERYTSAHSKNFINFSNEEFDQVVAQAKAATDQAEQVRLYKRAEEILNETAASLWIQDMCDLVVMDPALDGFTFYSTYVLDMSTIGYK